MTAKQKGAMSTLLKIKELQLYEKEIIKLKIFWHYPYSWFLPISIYWQVLGGVTETLIAGAALTQNSVFYLQILVPLCPLWLLSGGFKILVQNIFAGVASPPLVCLWFEHKIVTCLYGGVIWNVLLSIPQVQLAVETPNFSLAPRSAGILHLQTMQKTFFWLKLCVIWLGSKANKSF